MLDVDTGLVSMRLKHQLCIFAASFISSKSRGMNGGGGSKKEMMHKMLDSIYFQLVPVTEGL